MNHTFLPNDEMQILGENRHSETNSSMSSRVSSVYHRVILQNIEILLT